MSIYKIEPICEHDEGEIYVGSTTLTLNKRMVEHIGHYKRYKNGKDHFITSFILLEKYGIDNCRIILLELVNCNNKDELLERESHYIRNLKCVNKFIPNRTKKEYQKIYCEKNKEELKNYKKEYYEQNKKKISEKGKIKFICECGSKCRISDKRPHLKTKKHIAFMEEKS